MVTVEGSYRVLSRAHAEAIISRADRARDIIGPGVGYSAVPGPLRTRAYIAAADNYSGQLDIPRACKHARTRMRAAHERAALSLPATIVPRRSLSPSRCSSDP